MFSNLFVDPVIDWLEVSPVCNSRNQQGGVLVDISTPGLIHNLIAQDIVTVCKSLSNFPPELSKLVQQAFVVVVEPPYGLGQCCREMVVRPADGLTVLTAWVVVLVYFIFMKTAQVS